MPDAHHPQKGAFISNLEAGERFVGFYLLRKKQLEPFRDPSKGHFLTLILGDRSGQLPARVWEGAEEADASLLAGEVVKVEGEVEIYQERKQIRVFRVRPGKPEEFNRRDMLPSSPRDPEKMSAELRDYLGRVADPHLRALLDQLFSDADFLARFSQAPAARRVHHAYLGGLIEHTLEMLSLAERVLALYPQINADLLYTCVLLHDVGKIREYTWDLDLAYSDEGRLLGHIAITDEIVSNALRELKDFPPELALRLRHALLAHHGRYEWGSPRRPKTLEAIALHHIENLSAQVNRFSTLLEATSEDDAWTSFDRMLRRQLYAGEGDDLSVEERSWTE